MQIMEQIVVFHVKRKVKVVQLLHNNVKYLYVLNAPK
jgi:hypothetical protein